PSYAYPMAQRSFPAVALILHNADNVAVLKAAVKPGDELLDGSRELTIGQSIGPGHKIALVEIPRGGAVWKYGQLIGHAREPISPGEHVHGHNLELQGSRPVSDACSHVPLTEFYAPEQMRHFLGYARANGRVGTRNYIAVISSVNCSASVSGYVRDRFRGEEFHKEFPNVDGVVAFTHKSGCAMDPGEPQEVLRRVLAGIARHPNISGFVLIGLGCEVNQVEEFRRSSHLDEGPLTSARPAFLNIQSSGGVRKTVEAGVKAVTSLLKAADELRRTSQPLSKLVVAENCGGSDGNSGITANPALGAAADELVRYGASVVLGETPEIYGAEHLLLRRAVTREVAEKLLRRIRWWENYARMHNSCLDNNPSPGNKAGGLTNIYEKSLGAVAKAGQSALMAVYDYAEPITSPGLGFMDTPGYDPVSMTGLVAGGCNIGVFTTGRGSVYGCKPAPCIKVATNTALFEWMRDDMDLNAGTILEGTETVQTVGARILEKIIAVASGEKTKSELCGIGDEEFAPWILGPTF
ncbi:MAG TPA: altronate dehydratase family protein, partial [Verrucomicrobiae bacterium]|nr:altronate dehydratase family protein [Verrucomicrobiae bacterium]